MSTTRPRVTVEWDAENSALCNAIVEAVAEAEDVDPLELETPLNDVVDPDALERLFGGAAVGGPRGGARITFPFEGCDVTVTHGGLVTVRREASNGDARAHPAPLVEHALGSD